VEIEIQEYGQKDVSKIRGEILPQVEKYFQLSPVDNETDRLYMNGYVGSMNITPECTLHSYPKVGISNVLKMYDYATLEFRSGDFDVEIREDDNFFDLLTRFFINEVEKLCRSKYRRFYAPKTENLLTIKGKVLIAETVQRNILLPHVYCEYQDFTDDILDNQILKYANYLLMKANVGNVRIGDKFHKLRGFNAFFDNVSINPRLSCNDVDRVKYTRLNQGYEKAHKLSRFFIEHLHVTQGLGNKQFYSFMIPMDQLFEDFVRQVMIIFKQTCSVIDGNRGKKLYLDSKKLFAQIKPDIILQKGDEIRLVLDCKYKKTNIIPDDDEVDIAKPSPSDIYQMVSYMVGLDCPHGVLIYPKDECERAEIPIQVEDKEYTIHIRQIDLRNLDQENLRNFTLDINQLTNW
jgi:5-methylcytosine-specific restriction enzyme subunit McrC